MMLGGLALANGLVIGAAPQAGARVSTVSMASIADTAASLQGPEIFWGSAGVADGYDESDIKGYDGFGTFLGACKDAGIELSGTVFAPTDATIADFVANGGSITPDLLKYHVLPAKVTTSQFSSADLKTVNGKSLTYRRMYRKDFIDDATPGVKSEGPSKSSNWPCDVQCDNGVLHSCNAVLVPGWEPQTEAGYARQ